jgi:hypothetical protein
MNGVQTEKMNGLFPFEAEHAHTIHFLFTFPRFLKRFPIRGMQFLFHCLGDPYVSRERMCAHPGVTTRHKVFIIKQHVATFFLQL